jgi:hypothetical protein
MLSHSTTTFVAYETIPAGSRVVLRADGLVALAGVADTEIGTAILHSGKSSYAAGDPVGVALVNHPGTVTCVASEAITKAAVVKRAAGGKVAVSGAGTTVGIAFESADADGEFIEVLRAN